MAKSFHCFLVTYKHKCGRAGSYSNCEATSLLHKELKYRKAMSAPPFALGIVVSDLHSM